MGDQEISPLSNSSKTEFLRHLLDDIEALEQMIEGGIIESGKTRIGAEQEFCLVKPDLRPAQTGPDVLKSIDESHFTAELAMWNLEINLDPQDAGSGCLRNLETQLNDLLKIADEHARQHDSRIVLTGILPTIRKSDLDFKFMTPNPRYRVLDAAIKDLRGEDFSLFIEGVDEVNLKHGSILFEACNTSFQVHLQVDPDQFADMYNWAQVLAGPVLSCCVNSPVLLGKELWSETRIALFRQSIEIRHAGNYIRDKQPRVAFGHDWIKTSAAEIFKNDVAFYKLIVAGEIEENSLEMLARGDIPQLRAMNLHNGTLYKWNRACYGVGGGKPHMRIENRYIPAGPTPRDQIANTAFWIGLMQSLPDKCRGNWENHFYFQEVRSNFLKAARNGLYNELNWFGKSVDASRLILDELLPMAESGLSKLGIESDEYKPLLDTIQKRVEKKQTGSSWVIDSLRSLRRKHSVDESTLMITKYTQDHCLGEVPIHEWEIPGEKTLVSIPNRYERVDSIMATYLVTVREDDLLDFADRLMEWNGFKHLPVEDIQNQLTGVLSRKDIDRFREENSSPEALVAECMTTNIITVAPEMTVDHAEKTMVANGLGSLPVVRDNRVIGMITATDLKRLQEKIETQ